ncbi:hypothetical protein [Bacteriovorax sp. Seq25_V]|uniref:hypothetical protein n=1 Tax=Bacteriovorax sp. Seq25_V TaxID=1201288 RepID=UPI00038A53F2|nr:hypothetical protein [Bacteriovorax sp. Seq25_V]EQC47991.1 hypothetical protein M900_A0085 [Bacteriovorax sp. Seq25_V]
MKLFLALITLYSTTVFGDCGTSFNNGVNHYNFATTYFNTGVDEYNRAVEEASKPTPNFDIVCRNLLNSYAGFFTAKNSFKECRDNFAEAVKSCSGDNKLTAMKYSNVCYEALQTSLANINAVEGNIKGTCYTRQPLQEQELFELGN